MGDTILWKYCAWLALFSSPAIPLLFAARALLRGDSSHRLGTLVPTAIAGASLLWFDAAMADYRFVGPLHGFFRYVITGGNLGTVLLCALFCLITSFRRGARAARLATALACLMLAAEWTRLGIIFR
jgi:hypothetical protein